MANIERFPAGRKHKLRTISALIFLVVLAAAVFACRGVGRWLVREDPLTHADALVVLSGGLPYRAEAAAHYFESVSYTHLDVYKRQAVSSLSKLICASRA